MDNESSDKLVAIKIFIKKAFSDFESEAILLQEAKSVGIPKYLGKGYSKNAGMPFILTEILGPSLMDLLSFCGGKFTLKTTLMLFY